MSHELISAVQEVNAAREAIRLRYSVATHPVRAKEDSMKYLKADHRVLLARPKTELLDEERDVLLEIGKVVSGVEKGTWDPMREELKRRGYQFLDQDNQESVQLGIAFINLADSII